MSDRKSTAKLSEKLKATLRDMGKKGETYEDVIWRLLESHEQVKKK